MHNSKVIASWSVTDRSKQTAHYDAWADKFERDLYATGYRLPAVIAAVVARHLSPDAGEVLDAGCGTGLQAEPLALAGYGPLVGIDLSEGMLAKAHAKGIYDQLHRTAVDERIDLADGRFAAAIAAGVLTPGHAPPEALAGLARVVRKGGYVAATLRDDPEMDPAYIARAERLESEGVWRLVYATEPFAGMPYGELGHVTHRVRLYQIL